MYGPEVELVGSDLDPFLGDQRGKIVGVAVHRHHGHWRAEPRVDELPPVGRHGVTFFG
jgi:hypothetical protein